MANGSYVPVRGDAIWLDFDPQAVTARIAALLGLEF